MPCTGRKRGIAWIVASNPRGPTLGQAVQLATLISVIANINWKGLKAPMNKIKELWGRWNLNDYWGRLVLVLIAAGLLGFVLFDWRHQAVQNAEKTAALAVVTAERDTLALKVSADEAARVERARILTELAELNTQQLEQLQESIDANPDWANQPLPRDLRERLR